MAATPRPIVPSEQWVVQPSFEKAILKGINEARVAAGVGRVQSSAVLRGPARAQSKYLAVSRKGKLQHQDAKGRPFYRRLVEAGWEPNTRMSENLFSITACRAKDPSIAVRRWLASTQHRKNMLDPKVTHVGVGVVSTRRCGVSVYTTDFGQLKNGARGTGRWINDAQRPPLRSEGTAAPKNAHPLAETAIDFIPREKLPTPSAPERPSAETPTDSDHDPGKRKGVVATRTAPSAASLSGRQRPRVRLSAARPRS